MREMAFKMMKAVEEVRFKLSQWLNEGKLIEARKKAKPNI